MDVRSKARFNSFYKHVRWFITVIFVKRPRFVFELQIIFPAYKQNVGQSLETRTYIQWSKKCFLIIDDWLSSWTLSSRHGDEIEARGWVVRFDSRLCLSPEIGPRNCLIVVGVIVGHVYCTRYYKQRCYSVQSIAFHQNPQLSREP